MEMSYETEILIYFTFWSEGKIAFTVSCVCVLGPPDNGASWRGCGTVGRKGLAGGSGFLEGGL